MFVGWIRKSTLEADLAVFEKECVLDKNLIRNSALYNQNLCFAAYEEEKIRALISAVCFTNHILINNFSYDKNVDEASKKRVIGILLKNLPKTPSTLLVMAHQNEKELFYELGFEKFASFSKMFYSGGAVFNFTNATSKSISNENFLPTLKSLETRCFKEDRSDYITKNIFKTSSLLLSNEFGYQHSYALNSHTIKLSPWIMQEDNFDESEKFLRGVIYHRGLKKIIAFAPYTKEVTDLYLSYKFEVMQECELLYKNSKPDIDTKMIYAF